MTTPAPQTLDEILAAGQTILNEARAAENALRLAELEAQERTRAAILTAAARHYPAALNEYATVEQSNFPFQAKVTISTPNAFPVLVNFHFLYYSRAGSDDYTDVNGWGFRDGTPVYFPIAGRHYPIDELPMVLAMAREQWEPQPEPKITPAPSLFDSLINELDLAEIEYNETGNATTAARRIAWVQARALIDIAISLDAIASR